MDLSNNKELRINRRDIKVRKKWSRHPATQVQDSKKNEYKRPNKGALRRQIENEMNEDEQ